jgi:hypothetical protein
MKGPLVFEDRTDRIACMLGLIEAAEILPLNKISVEGMRAMWSFWLRGFERRYILATDTETAKAAVQEHALAWLRAAAVRPMTAQELDDDRETRPG